MRERTQGSQPAFSTAKSGWNQSCLSSLWGHPPANQVVHVSAAVTKVPLVGLSRRLDAAGVSEAGELEAHSSVLEALRDHVKFRVLEGGNPGLNRDLESSTMKTEPLSGLVLTAGSALSDQGDERWLSAESRGGVPSAGTAPVPVVNALELVDDELRDRFLTRVFTLHRWRQACGATPSVAKLQAFHGANKSLFTAHDESSTRALGRSIASCRGAEVSDLAHEYIIQAMRILDRPAGRGAHVNVLQHVLGHFRGTLEPPTRAALHEMLGDYAQGQVPLAVVREVLLGHARAVGSEWLRSQTYLAPYPMGLGHAQAADPA